MYTLAVEHRFTKGRKSMNVVAVCLYVACRQKETRNFMLIDFSDLLQVYKCFPFIFDLLAPFHPLLFSKVNVFELGHTYLQLVQTLNLRLPLVDPSHYISRFSALLEFGDETHTVATDAVRLVQRFDRDWMTRGRRPAGICGAALLLAARISIVDANPNIIDGWNTVKRSSRRSNDFPSKPNKERCCLKPWTKLRNDD